MTHNPAEALREIVEMIDNCADVPRNPDSLIMMVLAHAKAALASPAPAGGEVPSDAVLIWSGEHRLYWRPNASGYTADTAKAGRYTPAEAAKYIEGVGPEKQLETRPVPRPVPPPPSPEVAGVVEMLREGARSIDNDATSSQAGPSSDQLCEAATLLESLSAEKGRLVEALTGLMRHAPLIPDHFTDTTFVDISTTARSVRRARALTPKDGSR